MHIEIGLAGWGDHDSLYAPSVKATDKLSVYAKHFSIVEVDSTFYAIQSQERIRKWLSETPASFKFIVKAYQGMTGHQRGGQATNSMKREEMFDAFIRMIEPIIMQERLLCVLFQYPPWFDCMTKHVMVLRAAKKKMGNIPCAIEFRNQTWYAEDMRSKTLNFLEAEGWIHSVCDEPQAGIGSIPIVPEVTNEDLTIVRFHGRNVEGWNDTGHENWREVRYLYEYSKEELLEWKERLALIAEKSKQIAVIFNNNSGGHAAHSAKQMMDLLSIVRPDGKPALEPMFESAEQLELF